MTDTALAYPTRAHSQTVVDETQLVPALLSIAKSTRAFLALLLSEIDLHPGQDQLLQRLQPNETISVSLLAEQLAVRPSTVSKMLDRLIEKNLVARASNSRDARRTMVSLTEQGQVAKKAVKDIWDRLDAELSAAMPKEQFDRTLLSIRQIDDLLATKLRRLR